jgi:23S rRNA-/tRNA-specific pseudouridylate synthase
MREAITEYKVLGSRRFENFEKAVVVESEEKNSEGNAASKSKMKMVPAVTLIEARPITGRTHQIRVHMHFSHHPVVGDSLYAPNHPKILGFNRLALHSRVIEFTELGGSLVRIEAPLPADFLRAIVIFEDKPQATDESTVT